VIPKFLIPYRFLHHTEPSFTLFDLLTIPALTLPYLLTSLIPLISTFHGHIPFYPEIMAFLARAPLVGAQVPRIDGWLRDTTRKALRSPIAQKTIFRVLDKCETLHDYLYPFHVINRYAKFGKTLFHPFFNLFSPPPLSSSLSPLPSLPLSSLPRFHF
jgi:hypothetical protein